MTYGYIVPRTGKKVFLKEESHYIGGETVIACTEYSASLTGKIIKNLLQNGMFTLCILFGSVNYHKSNFKVRIYANEKPTFLKKAPYFKG